jgi:uncharacterized protein
MGILSSIKKIFGERKTEPVQDSGSVPSPNESSEQYYIAGIQEERAMKDRFFRMDPYSPIQARTSFDGLDYYDPKPDYRYTLTLQPAENKEVLSFQTSTGDEQIYDRLGTVEFEVEGEVARLAIYQSPQHEELFLPFRDATSGHETYGAGRYLEPHDLGGGELLVDFNLCYNPFCAYSDDYSCPLPPFENHLTVAIRAGEKAYKK